MIAIPIDKPKNCNKCPFTCEALQFFNGTDIPQSCPLIEIVTCGECVHWYSDADCGMACEFTNMKQSSDGFCNWGEKRTETLDERIKRGLKEWKEK